MRPIIETLWLKRANQNIIYVSKMHLWMQLYLLLIIVLATHLITWWDSLSSCREWRLLSLIFHLAAGLACRSITISLSPIYLLDPFAHRGLFKQLCMGSFYAFASKDSSTLNALYFPLHIHLSSYLELTPFLLSSRKHRFWEMGHIYVWFNYSSFSYILMTSLASCLNPPMTETT